MIYTLATTLFTSNKWELKIMTLIKSDTWQHLHFLRCYTMFILCLYFSYLWWYFKHFKYECFCLSPPNMKCNFAFCRNHCFVLEGEQEVKRVKCRKTSFLTLPSSIFICPPSWSSSSSWSSSGSSCFRRKAPSENSHSHRNHEMSGQYQIPQVSCNDWR